MDFLVRIPFIEHLGFELLRVEPGLGEIAIEVRDELTNSWGVAHGGLLMTLMDIAMAHAARSPLEPGGEVLPGVVTIEMKTSFMKAAKTQAGEHLVAKGELLHRTKKMAFTEAKIFDAKGALCAHSTGTFKYAERRPLFSQQIPTD
jgi:uncharacterized protein (TIGR00369 family)